MRLAGQFVAVLCVLILIGAGASGALARHLDAQRAGQEFAIERARSIYVASGELADLAERETTLLLAISVGAARASDLAPLRAEFARTLEEARALLTEAASDEELATILDDLERAEDSLFAGKGGALHEILDDAERMRLELVDLASTRREALDRVTRGNATEDGALRSIQLAVARERLGVVELAEILASGTSTTAARDSVLHLNRRVFDLALAEATTRVRDPRVLEGLRPDSPAVTTRALFSALVVEEKDPEASAILRVLGVVLADTQAAHPKVREYATILILLQDRTRASLGPRAADLDAIATRAQALGAAELDAATQSATQVVENAKLAVAALAATILFVVAGLGGILALGLRRRLRAFDEAAAIVSSGRFDAPAPPKRDDDFDALSGAWERMTTALAVREKELATRSHALQHNERMATLGSLLAGVAHEVNNPLAFIKAGEEMTALDLDELAERPGVRDDPAAQALIATMRQTVATHLDGIVRIEKINKALKGFASPGRSDRELIDLNDVVDGVLIIAHHRLRNRFKVQRDFAPLPRIRGSPQELGQIVLNLVINAAEASPEGGTILVRTRAVEGEVCASVIDEGPGVPPALRAMLFAPFQTSKENGTGLGLHISRQIAEAHGGRLDLAPSQKGACFTLTLPCETPEVPA